MKNSPLVSILTVTYNHENYIAECIDSILSSTYTNFELIVVDDISQDNTFEIAKKYEKVDPRVKVYQNNKNLGDYPNRNKAANYAKGKYIKYVDGDDLIYPHGLEVLIFHMEKFPNAGYGLCSLDQDDDLVYPYILPPQQAYERHFIKNKWLFHKAPTSSIINRNYFNELKGFTGRALLGDYQMWLILSQQKNVVLIPGGVVWHRTHINQLSNQAKQYQNSFKYLLIELEYLNHSKCPLKEINKLLCIKYSRIKIARSILRCLIDNGLNSALEIQKISNMSKIDIIKYALIYK